MTRTSLIPSVFASSKPVGDIVSQLQQEMDQVFQGFLGGVPASPGEKSTFRPSMDVTETAEAIDIAAELPGIDEKDIEITAAGDLITIRGEKKSEHETKDKNWHMVERSFGSFSRALRLPFPVDPAKVEAAFSKGVLKIHLRKPEGTQSGVSKILIKPAA
jgi:HSP20 family protein